MQDEKIAKFKTALEKERAALLQELAKESRPENFGNDVDDFTEETDEAESFANRVAAGQALKDRVSEIDIALGKISNGKYGKCENCGKDIEDEVLQISP